ncbi:MAG: alpha/beta fold hydrolase [Candidatus Lokiarchaeia archaeon]
MPVIKINDFEIYYEIYGEKNKIPLVLIMGLGSDLSGWILQIPDFSKKYRVIAFDNRDVGRTSKTDVSYTFDTFAEDTNHLLEKLRVEKAHILGISMGGMIAQAFALRHHEKVRSLILCATTPRGSKGLSILTIWKELIKIVPRELFIKENLIWAFTRETLENKDTVDMIVEALANYPYIQPPEAFIRQCNAIESFDVIERLNEINAPTLVLVGDRDILTPIWYAEEIASRIPNAELKVLHGCGHGLNFEKVNELNKIVLDFLEKH